MEKGPVHSPSGSQLTEEVHLLVDQPSGPSVALQISYDDPLGLSHIKNAGDSPESASLYSDEIPSGYNSGEQYDTLSTGYMSGEAYELPATRMAMLQPSLEAIDECLQGLGATASSDDNTIFKLPDSAASVAASAAMMLNPMGKSDDTKSSTSLSSSDSSSLLNEPAEPGAVVEVAAIHHQSPAGPRIGSVKSKLRKKVTTFAIEDQNELLYESSDVGCNDGETRIGGYRAVPSDTDTSNVDSDVNAVHPDLGTVEASGTELLRAARSKSARKKAKKNLRCHDEEWFNAHDGKTWSVVRMLCFWISILSMLVATIVSAVMIAMMPDNCDPSTRWFEGSVMLDVRPLNSDDLAQIVSDLATYEALGIRSLHLKYDAATTKEAISVAESLWGESSLSLFASNLHERNLSLIVQIPVKEAADASDGESQTDSRKMGLKLQHEIEDAVSFWTSIGADGMFLDGMEHFGSDLWIGGFMGQLHTLMKRYGRAGFQDYVLMTSYLFVHKLWQFDNEEGKSALHYIDLLHAPVSLSDETNFTQLSDTIADMAKWDSVDGRPWINWHLQLHPSLPFPNAAAALQMFLPGTVSVPSIGSVSPDLFRNLTQLRRSAVPIHMNGNYKRCHCEEGTSKEVNYLLHHPLPDVIQLERFYNRRNRFVLLANFGASNQSLAIISRTYTGGEMIMDTSEPPIAQLHSQISFKELTLPSGQAIVVKIPK